MRRLRLAAALALLASSASALRTERFRTTGAGTAGAGAESIDVVAGEAMARFDPAVSEADRKTRLAAVGAEYSNEVGTTGWTKVILPANLPVSQGLTLLATVPGLLQAEPNHAYHLVGRVPSDPLVNSQYALQQVEADAAWQIETGKTNRVTVAVADTGVDKTHPDLAAKFANTANQYCDPGNAKDNVTADDVACAAGAPTANTDACGHGTEVAGVAAAATDNGLQVAGMAWDAQLVSLKMFRDVDCTPGCGDATCVTDDQAIANAIAAAQALHGVAAYGKVVLNLSVGENAACPVVIQTAVSNAITAGVVIVAAAGNSPNCSNTSARVNAPANCNGVIPAAATNAGNQITSYSCAGPELATSGVAAPGDFVLTTANGGGTSAPQGTSFASPMVAGLAALVYAHSPAKTPAQIKADIRSGAESIGAAATSQGAGRINAFRTLKLADKGTLAGYDGEQKPMAFPNPFKPSQSGTVNFGIPPSLQGSAMKITIYTLDGQMVKELTGLSWNGKNESGNPVASGTYVFLVSSSAGSARGRFAVLR